MSTRREKSKLQINKQLETINTEPKSHLKEGGMWKENLGKYLIDISKYVVTGVIIASTFKDLDDKFVVYILSAIVAIIALVVGLVLTNKKKGTWIWEHILC